MANLVSSSFFTGPLAIPGTAETSNLAALNALIAQKEPEFLRIALGQTLADLFTAGLGVVSPAQKWKDLRDGLTYTYEGRQYRFDGLASTVQDAVGKHSPIAAYVYYWWCRQKETSLLSSGGAVVAPDGATAVSLGPQEVNAWNNVMRPSLAGLYLFLSHHSATYPDWEEPSGGWWYAFNPINTFGL